MIAAENIWMLKLPFWKIAGATSKHGWLDIQEHSLKHGQHLCVHWTENFDRSQNMEPISDHIKIIAELSGHIYRKPRV
jgi:hypothetical protein